MHSSTIGLVLLNFSGLALGLPAQKRQNPPAPSSIIDTLEPLFPSTTLSVAPLPSGAPMPSGMSLSGSAGLPMPSGSPMSGDDDDNDDNDDDENYPAYPCPSGYLLNYAISQMTYPYSLSTFEAAGALNWSSAPQYGGAESVVGTGNTIGSTRTRPAPDISVVEEVLVNVTTTDNFYEAVSNLTSPVTGTLNMVTFSNWSYVYQVYANDTAPQENDVTPTTVKIFANACASGDQMLAVAALDTSFADTLTNLNAILGGASPAEMPSASMDSAMPSAPLSSVLAMPSMESDMPAAPSMSMAEGLPGVALPSVLASALPTMA